MNCPKCNAVLSANSKFCTRCGTKIEVPPEVKIEVSAPVQQNTAICIKCGAPLKVGAKFCTKCGSSQNVQSIQPSVQSVQPPVQMAQPPVQTAQPPMQSVQPTLQTAQPPVQSVQPTVQIAQPPVQSVQPALQTAQSPVQSVQPPVQTAQPPVQATQIPIQQVQPPVQQAPKKKKNFILPLVIILLMIFLVVGGYFVMDKVFDVNPVAMILGKEESNGSRTQDEDRIRNEDDTRDEDGEEESDDTEEEIIEIDSEVLEALTVQLEAAKASYNEGNYENAVNVSKEVLQQYIALSEEYDFGEDVLEQISDAYEIASKAAIPYCRNILPIALGSAGYTQIRNTLDPILEIAAALEEREIKVDSAEIQQYSDGVVQDFKNIFIEKINEITERDQWSRDEAWTYAENAYKIQENGKTVLFDESDLDDPLRLRYVYCLSWIMRKRCENGVADGTMSSQDAFGSLVSVLEETDYNLLVLQDIITYGNEIGQDTTGYQQAYNAIVQKIKEEQNLSIVNSGVNSGTSVDVRKFWYFNDLSGEDVYKVDINNGTTQTTRDWIRNNAPSYIGR